MSSDRGLRLNVGCGRLYRSGFVNVDGCRDVPADIHADASALPFDDECAVRADYIHVLEHLETEPALRALSEAYRVLKPGGLLVVETPDPEETFRAFLRDEAQARRAQLLSWVFGLGAPGYRHHLLYPRALLRVMLVRAGFEEIRFIDPRYHNYAPGLRVEARRRGAPVHQMISALRSEIAGRGLLDLSHQLQALEFERRFFGTVLALGGGSEALADPEAATLDCILIAPDAAALWLARCSAGAVIGPQGVDRLRRVADAAVTIDLRGRMDALFDALCDTGPETGADITDGYAHLLDVGREALRRAMDAQEPDVALDALPAPLTPAGTGPRPPWTRELIAARVAAMRGRGLKHLCQGRAQEGIALLARAARSRIDPLYAFWNLGIAQAAAGDLDGAIASYQDALEWSSPETEDVLRGELNALGADGQRSDPRTRPVLEGEGLFHEPELE